VDLVILDISDPRNPVKISSLLEIPGRPRNCVVHESYVYVSSFDGGLRFIDVSSPTNPFEVGYYQTPTFLALNCFLSDPYVYVAAACLGLQIYEFYGAGVEEEEKTMPSPAIIQLLQNPIKGNYIELLLSSPENNQARITLYNQIGQRLRTYQINGLQSGKNILRLDAMELPMGIYFLKLSAGEYTETKKIIKIR